MEERDKPTEEQKEKWHADPKNWKLYFFYYNPEDPRLLPPKRFPIMGWTVNWANYRSISVLIVLIAVLFFGGIILKYFLDKI